MKLYTCCPKAECTTFKDALNFLHSYGIEPSILEDNDGHYFEFNLPEQTDDQTQKFYYELSKTSTSSTICKCGKLYKDKDSTVYNIANKALGFGVNFCCNCLKNGIITDDEIDDVMEEHSNKSFMLLSPGKKFINKLKFLANLNQEINENDYWEYVDHPAVEKWMSLAEEIQPKMTDILSIMIDTGLLITGVKDSKGKYVECDPDSVYTNGLSIILSAENYT